MRRLLAIRAALLLFGAVLLRFGVCAASPSTPFTFENTGTLNEARTGHTATLLQNGKVLVAAGASASQILRSAELYDPNTGMWTYTPSNLFTSRYGHTATLLADGKVLVVGGKNLNGDSLASA